MEAINKTQKNKTNFKNLLDKLLSICYNKDKIKKRVKRRGKMRTLTMLDWELYKIAKEADRKKREKEKENKKKG